MPDKWLDWIVNRRFGGDKKIAEESMAQLNQVRDKVIDAACIGEGDTVLDIGAGDGLLGFAALSKVGLKGKVIFSDISESCVEACREIHTSIESANPADFIVMRAQNLTHLQDNSIDVVVFRSVLIYIDEKLDCFKEFYRVLKHGGRISFFEPINIFTKRHQPKNSFYGHDVTSIKDLWEKIRAAYPKNEEASDPMMNFDEDDLFTLVKNCGFTEIIMDYQAYSKKTPPFENWDLRYKGAPNPNSPTLEEVVDKVLTEDEKKRFIDYLKPKIESEPNISLLALCYLNAVKE